MSAWHVTWQDPIALLLCACCVAIALRLRRTSGGCAGCDKGGGSGGDIAGGAVAGSEVAFDDLFETVGGEVAVDGIGGVELFEVDPGRAGHPAAV